MSSKQRRCCSCCYRSRYPGLRTVGYQIPESETSCNRDDRAQNPTTRNNRYLVLLSVPGNDLNSGLYILN